MKSCHVCGALIEENAIFCDACGALQDNDSAPASEVSEESATDSEPDAPETEPSEGGEANPEEEPASADSDEPETEEAAAVASNEDDSPAERAVPPPVDELIPEALPEMPKVSKGTMAPPAPIEFAAPRPVSTVPQPAQPENDLEESMDDTVPPPISYEGDSFTDSVPPEPATVAEDADAADELDDLHSEISGELRLVSEPEPSSRPALVAVLLGLLMLCVATWIVAQDNKAYELQQRAEQEGANPMERFDLGDVTLQVSGTEGAEVALDGQVIGRSPLSRKINAGTHVLVVSQRGFEPQRTEFTVKNGEKYVAEARLTETAVGMAWVESGSFFRGCELQKDAFCYRYRSEQPGRQIELDGFYIDETEVTVGAYNKCVEAGACVPNGLQSYTGPFNSLGVPTYLKSDMFYWGQPGRDEHPLNCVTWYEADQYCQWAGKDLPTEAQWEKAARGEKGRLYPWGNAEPSCHFAVIKVGNKACSQKQTWDVGRKADGKSPYGVMDMVGNVSEWVWDRFSAGYYAQAPSKNPTGPNAGFQRGIRGGAWSSVHTSGELRTSYRWRRPPTFRSLAIGFRCVKPAPGQPSVIAREPEAATGLQRPPSNLPGKATPKSGAPASPVQNPGPGAGQPRP